MHYIYSYHSRIIIEFEEPTGQQIEKEIRVEAVDGKLIWRQILF